MISRAHRCIFVHIPKCARGSIENVIWPGQRQTDDLWMGFVDGSHNKYQTGGLQHLLAKQIRLEVGDSCFSSFFKFTVVRNPFDRAVSQFAYMQSRADLRDFIGMDKDASFPDYIALIQRKRHVQWEPQSAFIYDDDGTQLMDFIGRFESLEADMNSVFMHLGIKCDSFPHVNASNHEEYRDYYTPGIRAQVEEMYADDLALFDYVF